MTSMSCTIYMHKHNEKDSTEKGFLRPVLKLRPIQRHSIYVAAEHIGKLQMARWKLLMHQQCGSTIRPVCPGKNTFAAHEL